MTPVFVHGWGFGPSVWDGVRARLPDPGLAVDLGFFGPEVLPALPAGPLLAVGHSYGVLWLLKRRPFAWAGLVSVNGFARFPEASDYPGVPARQLARMIQRFGQDGAAVTADFMRRIGHAPPAFEAADTQRLGEALQNLADWDERGAQAGPVLALAGGADPLVTEAMSRAAWGGGLRLLPQAGHLLPLTDPDWCAEMIGAFAKDLLPK